MYTWYAGLLGEIVTLVEPYTHCMVHHKCRIGCAYIASFNYQINSCGNITSHDLLPNYDLLTYMYMIPMSVYMFQYHSRDMLCQKHRLHLRKHEVY